MPSLTVLCGLCVVDVRLRLLLVLVLGRRVCRVIGLEGQVLLVGGACKNVKEGFYKYNDKCGEVTRLQVGVVRIYLTAEEARGAPRVSG